MIEVFDSIRDLKQDAAVLEPLAFVVALVASLTAAFFASILYQVFYENRGTGSQVHRAFPLLSISVTTLFIAIQISIPLSLGLLGALSIVRFRTPIKEPEEVGFIMLLIASAISCSTFNFAFLLALNVIAVIALLLIRWTGITRHTRQDGILILRLSADDQEGFAPIQAFLDKHTKRNTVESCTSKEGTTSYQLSVNKLDITPAALIEGIQDLAKVESINLFFNRPGGVR